MSKLNTLDAVEKAIKGQSIVDVHTHLYPASMGPLFLGGPDELITYHYLKAETSRQLPADITVDAFNNMPTGKQADVIWSILFVGDSSPISEAQIGIVTVMNTLGLNPRVDDLTEFRALYNDYTPEAYTDLVFEKSGVGTVYMTNDPLEDVESVCWRDGFDLDPRFRAVLRLDSALMNWPAPVDKLQSFGYDVETDLSAKTFGEIRRYLADWVKKMDARYTAISLPPDFTYPSEDSTSTLMKECVYPSAQELGIPSAMMVGVTRQVNPALKDGGDSLGSWDVTNLERIARDWPDVTFLMTILSREDQHELCVTARKFPNVLPFGCWWFLNNPSIIQEITQERLELLSVQTLAVGLDQLVGLRLLQARVEGVALLLHFFHERMG